MILISSRPRGAALPSLPTGRAGTRPAPTSPLSTVYRLPPSRFLLQRFFNQLLVIKLRVIAVHGQQFRVGAALNNFTIVQHYDFIGILDG